MNKWQLCIIRLYGYGILCGYQHTLETAPLACSVFTPLEVALLKSRKFLSRCCRLVFCGLVIVGYVVPDSLIMVMSCVYLYFTCAAIFLPHFVLLLVFPWAVCSAVVHNTSIKIFKRNNRIVD